MRKIRYGIIALVMLLCSVSIAEAQVSVGIGIGLPHVSIGINLPLFPELVPLPGYPVYYAPQLDANYFFYDGMYWVYVNDNWYASSWYNGPWWIVDPYSVPLFILRIPVRYYRHPPAYFHGWRTDAPPRWGRHWGNRWEQRRRGWDRWERRSAPAPAPLPVYQRHYARDRYPSVEKQRQLRGRNYGYQPREKVVQRHYRQQSELRTPAADRMERRVAPPTKSQRQREIQRTAPVRRIGPPEPSRQPSPRGDENLRRSAPVQPPPQQRGPGVIYRREQPARPQVQQQRFPDRGVSQEPRQSRQQDQERGR